MLNIDQEIKNSVHKYAKVSQEALKNLCPEFLYVDLVVKIDKNIDRSSHRGGLYAKGPGINMSLALFRDAYLTIRMTPQAIYECKEYAAYKENPIIGSIYTQDWRHVVMMCTGHEVAHAAQRYIQFRDKLEGVLPHGELFRKCYKEIRLVLNKELPDQTHMKEVFKRIWNKTS